MRGEISKYSWVDIGSSYLPSDLIAAFLWAQLEDADKIIERRLSIWNRYHSAFEELEQAEKLVRPTVPDYCTHNGHIYYLVLSSQDHRDQMIQKLKEKGILAIFHYVPLHSAPAGKKYGRAHGDLKITNDLSTRIVRLPVWLGVEEHLDRIIDEVQNIASKF